MSFNFFFILRNKCGLKNQHNGEIEFYFEKLDINIWDF